MAHYSAAGFSCISGITLPSLRKDTPFVYRVDFGQCSMTFQI
jgi:hypothetical protein